MMNVCVGICKIHEEYKICKGCYRTKLEIAKWSSLSDPDKIKLIKNLQDRKSLYGEINNK